MACDVIVLIIISAHAPARERALLKVEHVVSTVTNLGACPGAGTPKTSLLIDTDDKEYYC